MNYEEEQAMLETKIANLVKLKYKENGVEFLVGVLSTLCSDDQLLDFAKHLVGGVKGGHEPNQVTKDAIEEARNRNDPR